MKQRCFGFSLVALIIGLTFSANVELVKAQGFGFGKNRVQYAEFDWRFIRSDHFDVYYYGSENYYLASFSAQTLEAALKEIQEDFRHQISNRITVIIYDSHNDFSQTNVVALPTESEGIGGVTEPFKNRVILPFMGDFGDFRRVLHHELIHAVVNDMFYGGSVQSIISNNIQLRIPNWFNEGMAEYSSQGFDTNTDNFLRDAVISGYLPGIQRLSGYFWYRGGQSVWNYIVENYGREKIGEIFQRIKTTRSVELGFRQSIGLSIDELSKRWQEDLKKTYWPEIANRQSIKERATLLTKREFGGSYNTSPALSPQGDKIAIITNKRGYFDVVVISAITGEMLKTLIKGNDNVNFEELNILNPNLSWSPDGSKLALSAKSQGMDKLAIVDYKTGKATYIAFPKLDAMKTVAWSPDGEKIAFHATNNSFPDIYVYNLETEDFINLTGDAFTDIEPAWTADSKSVIFASDRGDKLDLFRYRENYNMLLNPDLHQKDLYMVTLGEEKAVRLTQSLSWNENRPQVTNKNKVLFISDQNGIPNVYELDLETKETYPLTDLLQGVLQMSANKDGSRVAVNTYNGGYLDVFLLKNPLNNRIEKTLEPNHWAKRRANETEYERVPAVKYGFTMFGDPNKLVAYDPYRATKAGMLSFLDLETEEERKLRQEAIRKANGTESDTTEDANDNLIDFRNYQFGSVGTQEDGENGEVQDSIRADDPFKPMNNKTDNGIFQPYDYTLKFAPDFVVSQGTFGTTYGAAGLTQMSFTDVLGNHRFGLASNLVFDLRNSSYLISYTNLENRTNWSLSYFHYATRYQTFNFRDFSLQQIRYRNYGAELGFEYPIDKFRRVNYGVSYVNVSRDFNSLYSSSQPNSDHEGFLLPSATFTSDFTRPGFLTPSGGYRYAFSISGSPPVTENTIGFGTVNGDMRYYLGLGYGYSIAARLSGAMSIGPDAQTFFLGGLDGWFNYRWDGNQVPFEDLTDIFFTQLAYPMRGFAYNTLYGDRYSLANLEFRFPLFAAILPGPIPIIPLYNMTGVFFTDFGAAWGVDQKYPFYRQNQQTGEIIETTFYTNDASLNFKISEERTIYVDPNTGMRVSDRQPTSSDIPRNVRDGDLLMGMGFGIRSILLGLPFRYDVGWPRNRDGFGDPIHYISIGLDF
jgi:Tol biopolymer transport system component